jgi:hypothetical protein
VKKLLIVILVVTTGLASGCWFASPSTENSISPLPVATSPISPETTFPVDDLVFSINEPLSQGDIEASGTGPQGIPIAIVDITLMGETLGRGRIGSDGHFTISVDPPLIVNHRIGITLDTYATDIEYTEELLAYLEDFQGDNAITIPHVGMIYDAASVQP